MPSSRAVSLAETIIAITLVSILSGIVIQVLADISKGEKKMEMQEYVAEEAWGVLEDLEQAISESAIDYEEYYSYNVVQGAVGEAARTFGENYGAYHYQFFNPSTDYDTGQNPYQGSGYTADEANAFCPSSGTPDPNCSQNSNLHAANKLFLIDPTGTRRTYFAVINNSLAKVELIGSDTDENGLIDTWSCAPDYPCTGATTAVGTLPILADFVRLTPLNFSIDQLTFFISPLEDPFKGFAETGSVLDSVQQQPKATIVLNAHYQLFDGTGAPIPLTTVNQYIGEAASVRLQTVVSSGVTHILPTYEP